MPARRTASPYPSGVADALNRKLHSLIPNGDVAYERKRVVGDLHEAIARAESEYLGKLAPPPEVLRKALAVINRRRTASEPDSVTYVLKRLTIFGFQICTGWRVVAHPLGGGAPDAGYVVGPCGGSQFQSPAWAVTPSPAPSAAAP